MKKAFVFLLIILIFPLRSFSAIEVSAKSAVLIEATTGRIIFEKNSNERLSMASTTKIMTALLTVEQPKIDKEFVVNNDAIKIEGTSMGLVADSVVTLRSLAFGMMLPSGNDAANAAAVKIAGNVPAFATLMNKRAVKIGMKNTNFVTPSGLDDPYHFSTAYDMALLGADAIKNPIFSEIAGSTKKRVYFGKPMASVVFANHNRLLKEYEGTIGIKTGFTKKSGRCLVSAVTRNDITLIAVTLKAPNDWADHKAMYDLGFSLVKRIQIDKPKAFSINLVGDKKNKKQSVSEYSSPTAPVEIEQIKNIKKQVVLAPFYYSPLKQGQVVGEVRYLLNGKLIELQPIVVK